MAKKSNLKSNSQLLTSQDQHLQTFNNTENYLMTADNSEMGSQLLPTSHQNQTFNQSDQLSRLPPEESQDQTIQVTYDQFSQSALIQTPQNPENKALMKK